MLALPQLKDGPPVIVTTALTGNADAVELTPDMFVRMQYLVEAGHSPGEAFDAVAGPCV